MSQKQWEDDSVQFPRLLAEIAANVTVSHMDLKDLKESMGLKEEEIQELFARAEKRWEEIKEEVAPRQCQCQCQ